ncbi:MAG: chemotaxis protein CheA [Thermodesulfobacteriota bacterium]
MPRSRKTRTAAGRGQCAEVATGPAAGAPSPAAGHDGIWADICREFAAEAADRLDRVEEAILACEVDGQGQVEAINRIMRGFHTVKGNAGVVLSFIAEERGRRDHVLARMQTLGHAAESHFQALRDGGQALGAGDIDLLLVILDRLRGLLAAFNCGQAGGEVADLVARIERARASVEAPAAGPPGPSGRVAGNLAAEESPCLRLLREALAALERGRRHLDDEAVRPQALRRMGLALRDLGKAAREGRQQEIIALAQEGIAAVRALTADWQGQGKAAALAALERIPRGLGDLADRLQTELKPAASPVAAEALSPAATAPSAMIRVPQHRLDRLMNLIGELLVSRTALDQLARRLVATGLPAELASRIKETVGSVSRLGEELQDAIMAARMTPVSHVFARFPRLIRDLGRQLGKQVRLELRGGDTELDRAVVEAITDPLVHLVRNAVDHGLESPEERVRAGKAPEGALVLQAVGHGQSVLISVRDDGRGLSTERIRAKLVARGLLSAGQAQALTREQLHQHVFLPGFSTAAAISEVSGRGVGMDVVRRAVEGIGGTVFLSSQEGSGTAISLTLPLTLAVSGGLEVAAGGAHYYLPLEQVVEAVKVDSAAFHGHRGESMVVVRQEILPVKSLAGLLGEGPREPGPPAADPGREQLRSLVILRQGQRRVALEVDRFFREERYVLKPRKGLLARTPGVLGAVITPDGLVNLVLDPLQLW